MISHIIVKNITKHDKSMNIHVTYVTVIVTQSYDLAKHYRNY